MNYEYSYANEFDELNMDAINEILSDLNVDGIEGLIAIGLTIIGITLLIALVLYIVYVIGLMGIFKKMGIAGWKAIIPVYNTYMVCTKVWNITGFILIMVAGIGKYLGIEYVSAILFICSIILRIMYIYKMMKAFNAGVGYTILYIFFPFIMTLVLGFGSAKYIGNPTTDENHIKVS